MRGDEIGDELLVEVLFFIDLVELLLQFHEHVELGLAHELEDSIAGVFRSYFQSTADMSRDQLAEVFVIAHGFVFFRRAVVQEQVIADA